MSDGEQHTLQYIAIMSYAAYNIMMFKASDACDLSS